MGASLHESLRTQLRSLVVMLAWQRVLVSASNLSETMTNSRSTTNLQPCRPLARGDLSETESAGTNRTHTFPVSGTIRPFSWLSARRIHAYPIVADAVNRRFSQIVSCAKTCAICERLWLSFGRKTAKSHAIQAQFCPLLAF